MAKTFQRDRHDITLRFSGQTIGLSIGLSALNTPPNAGTDQGFSVQVRSEVGDVLFHVSITAERIKILEANGL
jgi:hypothetical protein